MITEEQMSYRDMVKTVADGHVCGVCGGRLSVAWGGAFGINGYILRCGNDINHGIVSGHDKAREKLIRETREGMKLDSKSLMAMDENKMLQRVGMAKFPTELTAQEKKTLAQVAVTYGFDPLMGEISIYQGRPFVSIDGRYRKAQETGQLDGVGTRPATRQERTDWNIPEGDYFFRADVYVKGASRPFTGWGWVKSSETTPGSRKPGDTTSTYKPVQNNPQRMAEKRAEAQALRKAFHIPLPSAEDIGVYEEPVDPNIITVEGVEVDTGTGEVIEPQQETKPARDPATIKNLNDLYRACREDFGLQPADVHNELNVKSKSEITDLPADCYIRIAASYR